MITFLRFPSEETAIACLSKYFDEGWIMASPEHALDLVGPIDGEAFHVNLIGALPDKALPFVVTPAEPVRVFAA